jgi:hypothetical protein
MRNRRVEHTSRNNESHNGGGGAVIILVRCREGIKPSDNFLSLLISIDLKYDKVGSGKRSVPISLVTAPVIS